MILKSITITNFKSIEKETITIKQIGGGYTYTLIGVNESGKSSILKALFLKESVEDFLYPRDFHDSTSPVGVDFEYTLESDSEIHEKLKALKFPDELLPKLAISKVTLKIRFKPTASPTLEKSIEVELSNPVQPDFTLKNSVPSKKDEGQTQEDLNLKTYFETSFIAQFFELSHRIIFWKSESKYLITDAINLDTFSANPKNVSVPLKNCFELAGISNIKEQIDKIKGSAAETENLIEKLNDAVTDHIKQIWPGHPIHIKFNINGVSLTFLVGDDDVKYKSKTTNQRSDGFRQFISFLLTISAENNNAQISNTLLLLDEPEVHLHPRGQESLRDELIKISKKKFNNIVIFATHSNYMIDKQHIERCFRVHKEKNQVTKITHLDNAESSYSEVNYVVFDVATNDYHNELYGYLQEREDKHYEKDFEDYLKSKGLKQEKSYIKLVKNKPSNPYNVTLPTYIRNLIHHPENTENSKFTDKELRSSIEQLRNCK